MTESNVNVNEEVAATEEVVKTKRVRKAPVKVQKTAQAIIAEIDTLTLEHEQLGTALQDLAVDSVAYSLVNEAYNAKNAELDKALNTVYTI